MQCESREEQTGKPCRARASWIVAVGSRTTDEQAACGRHLNLALTAMVDAERRPVAVLTVRKVR